MLLLRLLLSLCTSRPIGLQKKEEKRSHVHHVRVDYKKEKKINQTPKEALATQAVL